MIRFDLGVTPRVWFGSDPTLGFVCVSNSLFHFSNKSENNKNNNIDNNDVKLNNGLASITIQYSLVPEGIAMCCECVYMYV